MEKEINYDNISDLKYISELKPAFENPINKCKLTITKDKDNYKIISIQKED